MPTANPLLALFKEQLEAECSQLAQKYELSKRGDLLNYWYFMRLHNFDESRVEEVFCDGGLDLGIDSIWIDDDDLVHFYNFKNPEDPSKETPAGEIDKTISGLRLILSKKHDQIANPDLKERVNAIYQSLPKGYRIHLVSSGGGVGEEVRIKMDALVGELRGPSDNIVMWDEQPIIILQEKFYQQTLPSVKDPIQFDLKSQPYMMRSGAADCYLFHIAGESLALLYEKYGEGLLQRNIRVDQHDTPTNRSIEEGCTGQDAANFVHFNNGVTFVCEKALFDPFKSVLTLEKAQVVNGGQTIRVLSRAKKNGKLKVGIQVTARGIASSGEKDFANNVAINQNNQNQLGAGFLRSNDRRVVQLAHAMASLGWYLERREGELKSSTPSELAAFANQIGHALEGRVIRFTDGAQAYTATFYGQPEVAKKNPGKIFLSLNDGGYYEKIFSADMTAEKVIAAHKIKTFVDDFVKKFVAIRRKLSKSEDLITAYTPLLGENLAKAHSDVINQVMPQCQLFVCGTLFKDLVDCQKMDPHRIPDTLNNSMIQEHLMFINDFAKQNRDKADKSWPVLLKSNAFFGHVTSYISGIRQTQQ